MNIRSALLAFAACALFTGCATTGQQTKKADNLAGTYTCASAMFDGKAIDEATRNALRLTFTEMSYKTEKGSELLFEGSYSVDVSKEPKEINMIGNEGESAGKESLGIYKLQNDQLEICYTMPGQPRPTEFKSEAGSKAYLINWLRMK
jgi:uncharacterized protein (TIGR03067 family)